MIKAMRMHLGARGEGRHLPIVVARDTGEIISKPNYTQDDYDRAWAAVARTWAMKHPNELRVDLDAVEPVDEAGRNAPEPRGE